MSNYNDTIFKFIDELNHPIPDENCYMYNDKIRVPRVTAILSSMSNKDGIIQWANSLGFKHKKYKSELDRAGNIGTECHESIDKYLDDKENAPDMFFYKEANFAFNSFLKWFNDIQKDNSVEIILKEKTLIGKYFGGTLDGLYKINGKTYLVDYKTSNHVTVNYTLQLAAYRYLLWELLGISIDGCIILQVSKNDISYNEYVLDFNRDDHFKFIQDCERCFMSMVFAYHNISKINSIYDNLDWRIG